MTALNSSGSAPAMPLVTWSQLMFTIAPPPACSRITAPAAYEHAMVPLRSTASSRSSLRSQSQSASSPVSTSAPALLTHTSRPPRRSCASATSASHPARVPRSARATSARPPADVMASATATAAASLRRYVTSTVAPASANALAIRAPMPLLAPVTTVRAPSRRDSHGCGVGSGVTSPRRFPRRTGAALRPRRRGCPAGWACCPARGRWTPSSPGSCSRRSSCRRPPPSG